MKKILLALLFSSICALANAQSVQQSGTVTPGHPAVWTTNGVIQDGGTAVNGFLTGLGVVFSGPGICQNSAAVTGAYNELCLNVTGTGGSITFANNAGATGGLSFVINGTTYTFPFTSSGVVGPVSSTVGNSVCWNSTSGAAVNDCGFAITAPGVASAIPYWSTTTALTSIAAVNSAVLVTSGAGVPSESTTLPSGLTVPTPTVTGTATMATVTASGPVTTSNTTASTTPTTGSIKAGGGLGVAGDLFVGGTANGIQLSNNQNASSIIGVTNNNTGSSAVAEDSLQTGTSGSSFTQILLDNAAPTMTSGTGSAVTTWADKMNAVAILTRTKGGGVQVGAAPTGGDKGAGTINAAGTIYTNNVAYAPTASPTFTGTVTMPDASTWTSSVTTIANPTTHNGLTTFTKQFISTFGTPTIASGACGATNNGSVSGTNQSGLVTIGAASTTTCTISFSTTITAPNACVIFPANATAAAQATTVARVSSVGTTNWVITGSALASSNYYYICL